MDTKEMKDREDGGRSGHVGHDGHGMGMMLVGCVLPAVAILLLPRLGVSRTLSVVIGIVAMVGAHALMMLPGRFKRSGTRPEENQPPAGHHH